MTEYMYENNMKLRENRKEKYINERVQSIKE